MNPKLLIIDDDQETRAELERALSASYDVVLAEDCSTALAVLSAQRPPVVLLGLGLPPGPGTPPGGLATFAEIHNNDNSAKIIIVSPQKERHTALQAVDSGAYDFSTKPVNFEELKIILKRAFHLAALERAYLELSRRTVVPSGVNLKEAREVVERDFVQRALQKHNGKIARAAIDLGISRPTLYELMEKLGVRRPEQDVKAQHIG
jgi:two-component system NtrC family response regulator